MKIYYLIPDGVYPPCVVRARTHRAAYEIVATAMIERGFDDPRNDEEFDVAEFEPEEEFEVLA
jgi:hypothetical protein